MSVAVRRQKELTAIISSVGYETADWMAEDDIVNTGLADEKTN